MDENNTYTVTSIASTEKTTLESRRANGNPFIGKNVPRKVQQR